MMRKILLGGLTAAMLAVGAVAAASPLVSGNVSLDSDYYLYVDKLEAMGYIKDMPSGTKPYSRLDMAKWIAAVDPAGMPAYLRVYYDEMAAGLAEEIAYVKGEKKDISNVKLREAGVEFSYWDMEKNSYAYGRKKATVNASYQPLNKNNNGHRYGDGFNAAGTVKLGGSLNKDFAVGLAARFSYDKDQNGEAKLDEGYVKTHLGVVGIELGRQPLQWGGASHHSAFALSNNARPQTMIKMNLLEPHTFDNGFLKFLGKANVNVFYSKADDDRRDRALAAGIKAPEEMDDPEMIGIRVDVTPTDYFTFGMERVSMLKSLNKDWLFGTNAWHDDQWNDIGGFDARLKFPGVQLYGSAYGEDQAGGLPCNWAYSAGLYFPQFIAQDGSWDLRLETAKTTDAWYKHGTFRNGWTYRDDIIGDAMGNNALQYMAEINHYMDNGDRLGFAYTNTELDRDSADNAKMQEFSISYAKKLEANMYLDGRLGYAKIKNAPGVSGSSDSSKLIAVGLRWEY